MHTEKKPDEIWMTSKSEHKTFQWIFDGRAGPYTKIIHVVFFSGVGIFGLDDRLGQMTTIFVVPVGFFFHQKPQKKMRIILGYEPVK